MANAGLRGGDIIISANDKKVTSIRKLAGASGEQLKIGVRRINKGSPATLKFEEWKMLPGVPTLLDKSAVIILVSSFTDAHYDRKRIGSERGLVLVIS